MLRFVESHLIPAKLVLRESGGAGIHLAVVDPRSPAFAEDKLRGGDDGYDFRFQGARAHLQHDNSRVGCFTYLRIVARDPRARDVEGGTLANAPVKI